MEDYPSEYFGAKATSFGILLRPRTPDTEYAGEEERICLSMMVPSMTSTEFSSAVGEMVGIGLGTLLQFPPSWGTDPLALASPGDFMMPMKFGVNVSAAPEQPARRSLEVARPRRAEASDPSGTVVARQGGFMDTLVSPERGLANLFMPSFRLNGVTMDNMYFKVFFLGIGFHPPSGLTLKTLGDAVCPSCGDGAKGPLTTAMDFVQGWPIVGEILGLLLNTHIHYVALRADNGVRSTTGLLELLGLGARCGYSQRGGASCSKPTAPPPPVQPRYRDAAALRLGNAFNSLKAFLASYSPTKLTFDLHIDTQFTTPTDPLDLGKLFTGQESSAVIENLNLRLEIVNIFNRMNTPRDYCQRSWTQNTADTGAQFDFEPPQARAVNLEIAASWSFSGLPLEVAFRREQNTKQATISAGRTCDSNSGLGGVIGQARVAQSQIGKNSWFLIVRFPRITILQIVCMARGVNPSVSTDNLALQGSTAQKCNDLFKEEMAWVPASIVSWMLSTGIDKPQKYGGRQGPLLPANGEYLGPQISIQLTGLNPLNWVWQFQGTVTLFSLPFLPIDLKFGRGPFGSDAVSAAAMKIPVTQLPRKSSRRRSARSVPGGPAFLTGIEFSSQSIGQVIKNLIDASFVSTAIDAMASTASGSVGFVITSQDINTFATPAMQLDLEVLRGMPVVPRGLTAIVAMRMTQPCQNEFCKFIIKHLGDVAFRLWANINVSPMALAMGAQLNNVILARDGCKGDIGSEFELGRPTFELSSVGIFMIADTSGITFGFNVFLTVDVGNLRGGDGCAYSPTPGKAYKFLEPLTFLVQISVTPTALYLEGAMIGIWTRAFGLDMLHFGNLQLGVGITAAAGLPAVEAGGELVLGKDCYIRDEQAGGLKANTAADCVGAFAYFGFSPTDPNRLYFGAGFQGLTLGTLVKVFAPPSAKTFLLSSIPQVVLESGFPKEIRNGEAISNPEFSFVADPLGVTTLTGKYFPGGYFFHGNLDIIGFQAKADIIVNPMQQLKLNCSISPLTIAGIFTIQRSASDSQHGPIISIDVQYGLLSLLPKIQVKIGGYMSLLGMSKELEMTIDNSGYHLFMEDRFLGLFRSSVWVDAGYGGILSGQVSFRVRAEMQNDFFAAVNAKVQQALSSASKAASDAVAGEQAKVDAAKAEVRTAQAEFDRAAGAIRSLQDAVDRGAAALDAAKRSLTAAQNAVNAEKAKVDAAANVVASKKQALTNAQNKVNAEKKKFDDASAAVRSKQAAVDNAKKKFDDATNALKTAKDDCTSKTNEVTKACVCLSVCAPWGPCGCTNPLYHLCGGLKTVANSLCNIVDGASALVSTTKHTLDVAKGALTAAEGIVNAAKSSLDAANLILEGAKGALTTAEATVRLARLAFDAANLVLEGAKRVVSEKDVLLGAAKGALEVGARAVEAAKVVLEPAIAVLSAANGILEGVKLTVRAGLDAAARISAMGLGGIVDVRYTYFDVDINTANGGSFQCRIDVSLFGGPVKTFQLAVNFRDLFSVARDLAEKAFAGIKSLV